MNLEFVSSVPASPGPATSDPERPPLLFLHGSFCGAWVWEEYFLEHFARAGWSAHAVSLRGHGTSGGYEMLSHWSLSDYVADVAAAVRRLGRPPILIGHSLGGMVAQVYAQSHAVPGMVLMASVPPDGISSCAMHMGQYAPELVAQISAVQVMGVEAISPIALHRAFFSPSTPVESVMRHLARMQPESHRVIYDMMMPPLLPFLSRARRVLVMGGETDRMIPASALHRTAAFWRADLVIEPNLPHGIMLDSQWPRAAATILSWLEE